METVQRSVGAAVGAEGAERPFEMLLSPGRIGTMTVRNRIVMAPMDDNLGDVDGFVTKEQVAYYEARAKGGAGLVVTGASTVDFPRGKGLARVLSVSDDKYLPGLAELAEAIKKHGARAAVQIFHAGREAKREIIGMQPVAPSPLAAPPTIWGAPFPSEVPHELTVEEIKAIVEMFAEAVLRCKRAGFDGVEYHANSAYLIDQFLSAASNKREDEYGGSIENRARFLVEIIRASKEKAGWDYPIWARLTVREYGIEDGIKPDEAKQFARIAQDAGIDAINTNIFVYGQSLKVLPPTAEPPGNLLRFGEMIKEAVDVPVIAVGRADPLIAEEFLRAGKGDFIAMGRSLITDPELPNKLAAGKLDEVIPCISCLLCHDRTTKKGIGVECTVNPRVGHELETELRPLERKKRVLVVGGGPSGMQAAMTAKERGHDVVLVEREETLGGGLIISGAPPFKPHLPEYTDVFVRIFERSGIEYRLGTEADEQLIAEMKPDAVVLAVGGKPKVPAIEGLDAFRTLFCDDVLLFGAETGDDVLIIGGGEAGAETAEFLVELGKRVTIVEHKPEVAHEMMFALGPLMRARLEAKEAVMYGGVYCVALAPGHMTLQSDDGTRRDVEGTFDSVILTSGVVPNRELEEKIRGSAPEVHLVGDCSVGGAVLEALMSGLEVGNAL